MNIKGDGDVAAEQEPACLERSVPLNAEVFALDLRRGGEAGLVVAVPVLTEAAEFEVEGDRLGHAAEGEVAVNEERSTLFANAGAVKGELRELFYCEEVVGAQVAVAIRLVGVDRSDLDGCLYL